MRRAKLRNEVYGFILIFGIAVIVLGFFVFAPLYANWQVCKQYYSKVSPLTCMMSTKTKISGDKE